MKRTKRIFAIFMTLALAMSMLISMSSVSFAAGNKSITVKGAKTGHTYTLYQVFTGTIDDKNTPNDKTDDELTNIQWGTDAPAAMKSQYATAAAAAKAVATQNDARAFAQSYTFTGGKTMSLAAGAVDGSDLVFDQLDEGYYVIIDTAGPADVTEGDFYSAVIVQLAGNTEIAIKGSVPTSEKKVADNNDTETVQPALADVADTAWQDSADYDIGDKVPFRLKATTADNVAAYKKYHITFQDKQCDGLDAPTAWTVTVLGKTFELSTTGSAPASQTTANGTKITVSKETPAADQTFAIKVEFEPTGTATTLNAECNNTDIFVKYEAVLNESANIGSLGNPNESYITYSNKPESTDGHEEGKTPVDKVIVFTYKTDIDKVDETGAALNGADFTLYKKVAAGTTGAVKGSDLNFATGVEHSKINANDNYIVVGNKTGSATGSTFEFKGIDDGTYVLVETTVPEGYNAWASKEVTVTATHDQTADNPKLLTLTATDPFTANKDAGNIDKKDGTTHAAASGELYAEIENKSGAVLPATGGIGTIIFYVLGSLLVVGCGIVLISKRRMESR